MYVGLWLVLIMQILFELVAAPPPPPPQKKKKKK